MGFVTEFKEFALKGNMIDLAVGVIIGTAFNGLVQSLVDNIITPAILAPVLKAASLENLVELKIEGTAITYGVFLSQFISFLLVAFVLFLFVRTINKMKRKNVVEEAAAPVVPSKEQQLLAEIRDLLKAKNN